MRNKGKQNIGKKEIKAFAIFFILVLILAFFLFIFRVISDLTFWIVAIISAVAAWVIIPWANKRFEEK